ncbi:chemotaxis protein CheB, partial [Thermodesulfobacteriota bacterium]
FKSAAKVFESKMVAAILTGMGSDGKEGVIRISDAGGKVIAESKESAVVFGMPNEAIKTGKVDKIATLNEISDAIKDICMESRKK